MCDNVGRFNLTRNEPFCRRLCISAVLQGNNANTWIMETRSCNVLLVYIFRAGGILPLEARSRFPRLEVINSPYRECFFIFHEYQKLWTSSYAHMRWMDSNVVYIIDQSMCEAAEEQWLFYLVFTDFYLCKCRRHLLSIQCDIKMELINIFFIHHRKGLILNSYIFKMRIHTEKKPDVF